MGKITKKQYLDYQMDYLKSRASDSGYNTNTESTPKFVKELIDEVLKINGIEVEKEENE